MESELKRWHNKPFAMWEPFTLLGFGVHWRVYSNL
jgi:hypothetical protein